MILFFFIVYIKKVYTYIAVCIEHQQLRCRVGLLTLPIARSDDTHWLSDKCVNIDCHQSSKPKVPQDDSHVCDQSHHNNQPLYQRLALVGKKSSHECSTHNWCLNVQRTSGTILVQPLICIVLVTQEQMPNMTPNATINVVMPLNASKCQCHLTITMTVIATMTVTCQHTHKTTDPMQLNRLQQATMLILTVTACTTVPTNASDAMWTTIIENALLF